VKGDGFVFHQKGSPFWWCGYRDAKGKEHREVCLDRKNVKLLATAENEPLARKYLSKLVNAIRAEMSGGREFLAPDMRRITVNVILDKLQTHYMLGGKKRIPRKVTPQMKSQLAPLRSFFGNMRAVFVNEGNVQEFISLLLSQSKANATINRSLSWLKQAYTVSKIPCAFSGLEPLDESQNVRTGKFTQLEAARLFAVLPGYLSDVAQFAYECGARSGEILKLRWSYVRGDAIEVPATDTKTRKARSIAITETIADIIARRRKARVGTCEFIFHNEGHAIKDYRKAWHSACVSNGPRALLLPRLSQ
jgi:hypothetical protein